MHSLSDDQFQDGILLDRLSSIEHDFLQDSSIENDLNDFDYDMIDTEQTPIKKLYLLTNRMKSMSTSEYCDADTILTRLIKDILEKKPKHLISNLRFIQRFRNHEMLTGESAYVMTMIIAVIQHVDSLAKEGKEGQSRMIYSLVANSSSSLANSSTKMEESSPSFMTRQLSDLNSMALTVFNTIGFVPKAIGAAVADTIRSRQQQQPQISKENELRNRLLSIQSFESATVKELRDMFEDYQRSFKKTYALVEPHI
jgi:hypothetical protein